MTSTFLLERFANYVRMHAFLQAILFVSLFFSALNIVYTVFVVVVVRSWLITWWIDRRFPFCLIPMWAFLLVSIVLLLLGIYCYPRNRPRFRFDNTNRIIIYVTIGIITWMVLALGITHTFYIGDFYVFRILENLFTGRSLLDLPVETIDVFPTLGDTVLIGYMLAFLFSFSASWRALRTASQNLKFIILRKPNMHWETV